MFLVPNTPSQWHKGAVRNSSLIIKKLLNSFLSSYQRSAHSDKGMNHILPHSLCGKKWRHLSHDNSLRHPEMTVYLRVLGWKCQICHIVRQHTTIVRIETYVAHCWWYHVQLAGLKISAKISHVSQWLKSLSKEVESSERVFWCNITFCYHEKVMLFSNLW